MTVFEHFRNSENCLRERQLRLRYSILIADVSLRFWNDF